MNTELEAFKKEVEEFAQDTRRFMTLSQAQLEQIEKVTSGQQETLFGKIPPDPENPGMVAQHRENTQFIKNVKTFGWKIALGVAGAIGVTIWGIFW